MNRREAIAALAALPLVTQTEPFTTTAYYVECVDECDCNDCSRAEMAAWERLSDETLLNCGAWE